MKKIYRNVNAQLSGVKYKEFESELVNLLKDNGIDFKTVNVKISAQVLGGLYKEGDSRAYRLLHLYGDALEEGGFNRYNARYLYQTDDMSLNRLGGFQQRIR